MAGIIGVGNTGEVALAAATAKTILQVIAAANHRVEVLEWGVYFDGTNVTAEPVLVELVVQTTAGTVSALTPVKVTPGSETIQTTASHTATAEPTTTDVIERIEVHPMSPGYEKIYPMGQETIIPGGGRLGIRATAAAIVNIVGKIKFEE